VGRDPVGDPNSPRERQGSHGDEAAQKSALPLANTAVATLVARRRERRLAVRGRLHIDRCRRRSHGAYIVVIVHRGYD
jgi:hypothetical protein